MGALSGVWGKHFHMVAVPTTVKHHHHGKARNWRALP